jgi:hypothetical protein
VCKAPTINRGKAAQSQKNPLDFREFAEFEKDSRRLEKFSLALAKPALSWPHACIDFSMLHV